MNIQKDWKAKLESAYYFMSKYSKITVGPDNSVVTQRRIYLLKVNFDDFYNIKYLIHIFFFHFRAKGHLKKMQVVRRENEVFVKSNE